MLTMLLIFLKLISLILGGVTHDSAKDLFLALCSGIKCNTEDQINISHIQNKGLKP